MLEFHEISNSQERESFIENMDPILQTWVVSNLSGKHELQRQLLKSRIALPEEAIFRATELWQKMFRQYFPEYKILSQPMSQTIISHWLREEQAEWCQQPGAAKKVFSFTNQLLPIHLNPENREVMSEWFHSHSAAMIRWGQWFFAGAKIVNLMQEHKWLPASWITGWLSQKESLYWPRELVFDLSVEISPLESLLIERLGQTQKVQVISPSSNWFKKYPGVFWSYELLAQAANHKLKPSQLQQVPVKEEYFKFASQLGEVKQATHLVRQLLERGVPTHEISILAADIEDYWPVLSQYLRAEGIAVAKPEISVAVNFPQTQVWLSQLRLSIGEVSLHNLEGSIFSSSTKNISYAKFLQLFKHVYDEEDLERHEVTQQLIKSKTTAHSIMSKTDFFTWSFQKWPNTQTDLLEILGSRWLNEVPEGLTLPVRDWISNLEGFCSKTEISVVEQNSEGVHCVRMDAAYYLQSPYAIVLGATEQRLRPRVDESILLSELMSLNNDMGFRLEYLDRANWQFCLDWIMNQPLKELYVLTSLSDFSSAVDMPSVLCWQRALDLKQDFESVTVPSLTTWDAKQLLGEQEIIKTLPRTSNEQEIIKEKLLQDMLGTAPNFKFLSEPIRLSVSSVERYTECPFQFAAEQLFHLRANPELDFDVDLRSRGQMMHKIFELLLRTEKSLDKTDDELILIVDECFKSLPSPFVDHRVWPNVRPQYVQMARKFLNFESQWRMKFPKTKTVGREVRFKGYWNIDTQSFQQEPTNVVLRGAIDRVDSDPSGNAVVIDYKSSSGDIRNYGSWVQNNHFQLPIYLQAVQSGMSDVKGEKVIGAFYFVLKDEKRNKGIAIKEPNDLFEPTDLHHQVLVTAEKKTEALNQINIRFGQVVREILSGPFAPKPRDVTICKECEWRNLCRAKHLM